MAVACSGNELEIDISYKRQITQAQQTTDGESAACLMSLYAPPWASISIQHWGGPLIEAPKVPRSNAEGVRIEAP